MKIKLIEADEVERATKPDAIVSCTSAQWICAADPECSEALEWYKRLCRPMFKGRKCTKKCQNTIETLRSLSKRQNAAKKLGKDTLVLLISWMKFI